jgi:hypothetical protein
VLPAHLTTNQRIRAEELARLERIYDRVEFHAWQADRVGRSEDSTRLYRTLDAVNERIAKLLS